MSSPAMWQRNSVEYKKNQQLYKNKWIKKIVHVLKKILTNILIDNYHTHRPTPTYDHTLNVMLYSQDDMFLSFFTKMVCYLMKHQDKL